MEAKAKIPQPEVTFATSPDRYRNLQLEVEGPVATIKLNIQEENGLRPGYELKLNSYDLGVDIELADAVQRLRFEHPEVSAVVVTSALDGTFSAGANIFMLGSSTHGFKVNFCKFTNETRLYIEDATEFSGQTYVAALNGIASGGGYELPLACEKIYLVDDRRSAVALPEVPYLGVLPGTGGLTRVVDKRMVRQDLADVFCTLAEGVKGKRAVKWNLVDAVFPTSKFDAKVKEEVAKIAGEGHPDRKGVKLEPLNPTVGENGELTYQHVELTWGEVPRTAKLVVKGPTEAADLPEDPTTLGCGWYPLQMARELDDAILRLRFNHPDVGLVLVETRGDPQVMLDLDAKILARKDHWFVNETILQLKRVMKRYDLTAKSFFALIDKGSCFAGTLFELALGADRAYFLEEDGIQVGLSAMNAGPLPMSNGLTRLQTRFLADPERPARLTAEAKLFEGPAAEEEGLITELVDEFDWDDLRVTFEERASLSPDSLTGMEASLRFAGPETLETKIFGRLSAWQNWIFQRPNAVGPRGALTLYGQPEQAEFDFNRT